MKSAKSVLWLLLLAACQSSGKDDDPNGDPDPDPDPDPPVTGAYASLTFTVTDVAGGDPTHSIGWQGTAARAADGTVYYAYLKYANRAATCDIAAFGGDEAPGVNYDLEVAIRAPGATTWSGERVPLEQVAGTPYVTSRYGLDAVVHPTQGLLVAFAGGASGTYTCGSGDLVLAERAPNGTWALATLVADSAGCCSDAECGGEDVCRYGTDVGPWAALALDAGGAPAIAYMDYHDNVTRDGVDFRGLELWEDGSGIRGIRPWSGKGTYADFVYVQAHAGATYAGPVVAYTARGTGVFVARLTGTSGTSSDWQETPLYNGYTLGERLRLAQSGDGTLGLVFFARRDAAGATVDDLVYCASTDNGATWSLPCENVDLDVLHLGQHPSLAFDTSHRPLVTYYVCGASSSCDAASDGIRLAWREAPFDWRTKNVHFDASRRTGTYGQLLLDPDTNAPLVLFQDLTRGTVMAAQGRL